ncbi:MAG: amino acid permease [Candidatus Eremiobacteraeota bacterium]|nr:amino acid permease [Candidatus Eremiobacteraeota bacterium]
MIRGIGLRGAVSINLITMIGIGPLITIPLVLANLHGSLALFGWVIGAIVAICDGLVWAELASRYPGSGGTYVYLREAFGRERWGRLFAFLFNWQFFFSAPLLLASGYIGFAQYAAYLYPPLSKSAPLQAALAATVGVVVLALLYRQVHQVATLGIVLGIAAVLTLLLVIAAGLPHLSVSVFRPPLQTGTTWGFLGALGAALVITLYDYSGYNDAALVGDEVITPEKTIPRSILLSIGIVAGLYILLQLAVLSLVPWQHLIGSANAATAQYVASIAVASVWGTTAAQIITVLILVTAFASTYGLLLGFSRIPYAAARDDAFFPIFGRLHPTGKFPYIALLVVGLLALPACFLSLNDAISFLTAGIVLIQAIAQIGALVLLRRTGPAPFRMWLYPLPAAVALIAWIGIFLSSGSNAMKYGILTLAIGVVVYFVSARIRGHFPFAAKLVGAVVLVALCSGAPAQAAWNASTTTMENGYPVFTVDERPFFVYGAAFFYERIPVSEWRASLLAYKSLGINTIDLYLIWNWHELRDGDFDFTGRTNARRNLPLLFGLIHELGLKIIVRPGPVIRNEWRNGGYPSWLLRRPEYAMPLHDILEGRYPATATLQNTHSDDAAAEWLRNATHMHYASRWLRRVLTEITPWHRDIVAIAVSDDQGAYIDNQTWPAPNFQRYLKALSDAIRSVTGPQIPLFINTYQMKVTASAPIWAWGNWYQSDAYSIGEHDRSQLEFSTGLLATQSRLPVMVSEFQAGWLQGADEIAPRPADPTNTELALHTMLQMGAHGVINFPVQDTLDPAGWEAPWSNAVYGWDAALDMNLARTARAVPTAAFGAVIANYGSLLAQTHPVSDLQIAYLTSAYRAGDLTNAQIGALAAATIDAQKQCRSQQLHCTLLDLRYASLQDLQRTPRLILPDAGLKNAFIPQVAILIANYRAGGGRILQTPTVGDGMVAVRGIRDTTLLAADDGSARGFLDIDNYSTLPIAARGVSVHLAGRRMRLPQINVAPRSAALIPISVNIAPRTLTVSASPSQAPLGPNSVCFADRSWQLQPPGPLTSSRSYAYSQDLFEDGAPVTVLQNDRIRLVISPQAGARAFIFTDSNDCSNSFTSIGGLRDTVTVHPPISTRDYIGKYTHPLATGTFNRAYSTSLHQSGACAIAEFRYDAPDVLPHGAMFDRIVELDPHSTQFTIDERVRFHGPDIPAQQQAEVISSLSADAQSIKLERPLTVGLFNTRTKRAIFVGWPQNDVASASFELGLRVATVGLRLERGGFRRTVYALDRAETPTEAQTRLSAFATSIAAQTGRLRPGENRSVSCRGEVAER